MECFTHPAVMGRVPEQSKQSYSQPACLPWLCNLTPASSGLPSLQLKNVCSQGRSAGRWAKLPERHGAPNHGQA